MARFDVFANPDGPGALLDVQADLLEGLNTRLVVPLLPLDQAPAPAKRLNPVFEIDGTRMAMVTQFMAAVPQRILKARIGNLSDVSDQVTIALDMAFQGF